MVRWPTLFACLVVAAVLASARSSARSEHRASAPLIHAWLSPMMKVGSAGWCLNIMVAGDAWTHCGVVPLDGEPVVSSRWDRAHGVTHGEGLFLPEVAYVRVGAGTPIRTTGLPDLPFGLRVAAVAGAGLSPASRFVPLSASRIVLRAKPLHRFSSWIVLSRTPVPSELGALGDPGEAGLSGAVKRWWGCEERGAGASSVVGVLYTTCVGGALKLSGRAFAFALLRARQPGAMQPSSLPATQALAGHPGVVSGRSLTTPFVARRQGNGWLVLAGNGSLSFRLEALAKVSAAQWSKPYPSRLSSPPSSW
jgi:hypothetical protein